MLKFRSLAVLDKFAFFVLFLAIVTNLVLLSFNIYRYNTINRSEPGQSLEQKVLPNGWIQTLIDTTTTDFSVSCISFHSPKTGASMGYCTPRKAYKEL
jgi:hypothetical protein